MWWECCIFYLFFSPQFHQVLNEKEKVILLWYAELQELILLKRKNIKKCLRMISATANTFSNIYKSIKNLHLHSSVLCKHTVTENLPKRQTMSISFLIWKKNHFSLCNVNKLHVYLFLSFCTTDTIKCMVAVIPHMLFPVLWSHYSEF